MASTSPLISEQVLEAACFELLASSSVNRYCRKAMELSWLAELDDVSSFTLCVRATDLLDRLIQSSKRTPAEAEMAILLAVLLSRQDAAAVAFVTSLRCYGKLFPSLRWPVAVIVQHT